MSKDTELDAMRAWAQMIDKREAPVYIPSGVPVRDPSSQPVRQIKR